MTVRYTEAEGFAIQTNQRRKIGQKALPNSEPGVERESKLHEQIIQECKNRGWICFHGSMAHKTFRTNGENDFHCLLPNGVVIFVECKTATGKLSVEQKGIELWMQKLGHKLQVVRSFGQFLELCQMALLANNSDVSRSFLSKE